MKTLITILEKLSTGIANNLGRTGILSGKYQMALIPVKKNKL